MLELLHLSFRNILHQINHKFGSMRTDPPNLEMGISSSAVRQQHFEIFTFTYLENENNMNSTNIFGFIKLLFVPNRFFLGVCCLFVLVFFPMLIEKLQFFISSWEMWIPNSFNTCSWFGLQVYWSLNCNHMAYKCIQRMTARFSGAGKITTCFNLWLSTPIKQNALLSYPAASLKQRAWRP